MSSQLPAGFPLTGDGRDCVSTSTSRRPRTREQATSSSRMEQPNNFHSTHVAPTPIHRAPVLGHFSPSPTPRRLRENDTSKEIKPVSYPSLDGLQWTTPPVTPAKPVRSSTITRSQASATASHTPIPEHSDENPFISYQSDPKLSFSVKAELSSRLSTPLTNSRSSSRPASQHTTVKAEPHSLLLTPVADGSDYQPNRKTVFQSPNVKSVAQSGLVTPPATTRKPRPSVYMHPEDTPLKKSLFDQQSDRKPTLQTPSVKLEAQSSIMTPPPTVQSRASVYQRTEDTPLKRSTFSPSDLTAWDMNASFNPFELSVAGSSKSSKKKEGPKNTNITPDDLSKRINSRSSQGPKLSNCQVFSDTNGPEMEAERPSDALPPQLRSFFYYGSAAIFKNGQKLKTYQADDLQRLVLRERGEKVCGTEVINDVGFIVAYEMGLGKTVIIIALILINPAPEDFEGAKATLVVVPNKGMMSQWVSEIKKFAPHLKVCPYVSCSETLNPNADVVLVTYAQIRRQHSAFKTDPYAKSAAPLYHFLWWRKVDDEAHEYRNPTTKAAAAVWAVQKVHGLCLTGTPAQNSLLDFYPLFKTLGVTHENVHDLEIYQRKIYSKSQKGPITNPVARKLLDLLKENFCIFRSKIDVERGRALVDLPPRTDQVVEVNLSVQERLVYERVKEARLQVFAKIMRLRQACDHPILVPLSLAMHSESSHFAGPNCPKEIQGMFSNSYLSSKLAAMMWILQKCKGQKTIIFTHFTSMIPSIAQALGRAKICWAEYTGGMQPKDQQAALKQIAEEKKCSVIIISILAGSTGLNITSCNNVILLEPWWNPYTEEQAISRVHRIGQTLPVNVYRLVVKDSIEESIMETQRLKRDMVGNMYGDLDEATQNAWLEGP